MTKPTENSLQPVVYNYFRVHSIWIALHVPGEVPPAKWLSESDEVPVKQLVYRQFLALNSQLANGGAQFLWWWTGVKSIKTLHAVIEATMQMDRLSIVSVSASRGKSIATVASHQSQR